MLIGAMFFSACSSDDDEGGNAPVGGEVSVSKVFTNGVPKKAPGIKSITVDSEGRVTAMETEDGSVEFTYDAKTRAASKNVTMTIHYIDDFYSETDVWNLVLGANGFVVKAQDSEGKNFTTYSYNGNGQLTKFTLKDYNGDEIDIDSNLQFEYASNGDMTKAIYNEIVSDKPEQKPSTTVYLFSYTNSKHTSPLPNKGCIFATSGDFTDFYDTEFEGDLVRYAMYAGLLGKAQTNLILEYTYTTTYPDGSDSENGKETFNWTLDDNGFPLSNGDYSEWEW